MLKFDREWAEKIYKERPRGVRGVGRTTAAVYHAVKYAVEHPSSTVLYIAPLQIQGDFARRVIRSILEQEFPKYKNLSCISSFGPILLVPQHGPTSSLKIHAGSIESADREYFTFVADDLGEYADITRKRPPLFHHAINAIYNGDPPPGTR